MKRTQQRLILIIISLCSILLGLYLILQQFNQNIIFYLTPSELIASNQKKQSTNRVIRLGGIVKAASIVRQGTEVIFVITDLTNEVTVTYNGAVPNLFREKQGIIAKGIYNPTKNEFQANELLAKHDQYYMPPEVAKTVDFDKLVDYSLTNQNNK